MRKQLSKVLLEDQEEPDWVIEGLLARGTTTVLAGEAGAGKSFLCYTAAYCIAASQPFLGMKTSPTKVLYFDEENGEPDFRKYNRWVWHGLGCPEIPELEARLRIEHGSLITGWRERVLSIMEDHQPGLVIFDTATPCFSIKDENDNAEANEVMRYLRQCRKIIGQETAFLILKHEKMRDDVSHRRTIRGAKAWLGGTDQVMFHTVARGRRRKDGLRKTQLLPDKMRAYGLRQSLLLDPAWTDPEHKGLIINAYSEEHDDDSLKENL
jgi:RecA-family ATPase